MEEEFTNLSDIESEFDDFEEINEGIEELEFEVVRKLVDVELVDNGIVVHVGDCKLTWRDNEFEQTYNNELVNKEAYVGDLSNVEDLVEGSKQFLIGLNEVNFLMNPLKSNLELFDHYNREYEDLMSFNVKGHTMLLYRLSDPIEDVIAYFGKESGKLSFKGLNHNEIVCHISGLPDAIKEDQLRDFFAELDNLEELINDRTVNKLEEKPTLRYVNSDKIEKVVREVKDKVLEKFNISCDKFNYELCCYFNVDGKSGLGDTLINETKNPCFRASNDLYIIVGESLMKVLNNDFRVHLMSNRINVDDIMNRGALSSVLEIVVNNDNIKTKLYRTAPIMTAFGITLLEEDISDKCYVLVVGQGEFGKFAKYGLTNSLVTSSLKSYVEIDELGKYFNLVKVDKIYFTEKAWNQLTLNNMSWVKEAFVIIEKKENNKVRVLKLILGEKTFSISNHFIEKDLVNENFVYDMSKIEKDTHYNVCIKGDLKGVIFKDNTFGCFNFIIVKQEGENVIRESDHSLILTASHIKLNIKSDVKSGTLRVLKSFNEDSLIKLESRENWVDEFKEKMIVNGDDVYRELPKRKWIELDLDSKLTINMGANSLKVCKLSEFETMTISNQNNTLPIEDEFLMISKKLDKKSLVNSYKSINKRVISYSEIAFSLFFLKEFDLKSFKELMVPLESRNYKVELFERLTKESKCHTLTDFKFVDNCFKDSMMNWFCFKKNKIFLSHGWYMRMNGISFITDYSLKDLLTITQILGKMTPVNEIYLDDEFYEYSLNDQMCYLRDNRLLYKYEED